MDSPTSTSRPDCRPRATTNSRGRTSGRRCASSSRSCASRCWRCCSAAARSIWCSGDVKEALILLAFATLSVVITVVQETRTERVLEALRDLTSPRALVIRDGERKRIAGREVVRGDLIVLAEGDRVPADAVLVEAPGSADRRIAADRRVGAGSQAAAPTRPRAGRARPGGDDLPFVFSGTLVVRGSGLARGHRHRRRAARSARSASRSARSRPSRRGCRRRPRRLVRVCRDRRRRGQRRWRWCSTALLRGDWLDAVLAGIALGMSMLPEEFPVVLTVFMAMGAWRISRARVLTRRAAAIETLGSATVLCTDKTGTLTENRMTIVELRLPDGDGPAQRGASARTGAGGVPPADGVRRARQRARALRSDGEGLPRARPRAAGRRPSTCMRRLDARARLSVCGPTCSR